ncbi:hypothetical protein CYMTET_36785 [Cymbomonas tetramitiformis]|uniref:Uncharacterized protein n=1 Tax=Cymbomonas tetramitiformis TaxID=36881 RepID=A0AAE0F6N1_9CHLO|nr:hypothetical protein CYMTET_36785 [Cymbomonas tetramitiformis]
MCPLIGCPSPATGDRVCEQAVPWLQPAGSKDQRQLRLSAWLLVLHPGPANTASATPRFRTPLALLHSGTAATWRVKVAPGSRPGQIPPGAEAVPEPSHLVEHCFGTATRPRCWQGEADLEDATAHSGSFRIAEQVRGWRDRITRMAEVLLAAADPHFKFPTTPPTVADGPPMTAPSHFQLLELEIAAGSLHSKNATAVPLHLLGVRPGAAAVGTRACGKHAEAALEDMLHVLRTLQGADVATIEEGDAAAWDCTGFELVHGAAAGVDAWSSPLPTTGCSHSHEGRTVMGLARKDKSGHRMDCTRLMKKYGMSIPNATWLGWPNYPHRILGQDSCHGPPAGLQSGDDTTELREATGEVNTAPARFLVFSSVGDETPPAKRAWARPPAGAVYDVCLVYYGNHPEATPHIEDATPGLYFTRKGMKWENFATTWSDVWDYAAVWVVDADIRMTPARIQRMFSIFHRHELQLAQPAYDPQSFVTHHITGVQQSGCDVRYTNFVENGVMVLSAKTVRAMKDMLAESPSGAGLDYVIPHLLGDDHTQNIAVLDTVTCHHPYRLVGE